MFEPILLAFLVLVAITILTQVYAVIFGGFAPFVSTKNRVIERIMSELSIPDTALVYELGAGRAPFLREARRRSATARLVGIERDWLVWLVAEIQNSFMGTKVDFRRANLYSVDLKDADMVYCYLSGPMMAELDGKFKKELKPGVRIVSYRFPIPGRTPEKTIHVDNDRDSVYFYTV